MTNSKYMLDKSFQEIYYRIKNWINPGSGWLTESVDCENVNISAFSLLSRSTYIELPRRLRNSARDSINIKSTENKCFPWCYIRHLNTY